MGQAPPGEECNFVGNGTPFVKAGEFGSLRPIIREWTTRPLRLARASDVFVCVVGATCGKLNLGADCAIGRSVAAIRPNEGQLDQRFLYAFLQGWTMRLRSGSQGSAQGVISREMLERLPVPTFSLPEQRRIVAILDQAENLRTLREQADHRTADLIPALFHEMFGDPGTNSKLWPVNPVQQLLTIPPRNGISPSKQGRYVAKVLTLSAITGDGFDAAEVKESTFAAIHRDIHRVNTNDLLTCRGNGNRELVGSGHFPKHSMPDVAFPDTMIALRFDQNQIDRDYAETVWNDRSTRAQITRHARTTNGTFKVNHEILNSITLPVPPLPLQKQFAAAVADIRDMQQKQAASKKRLDDLFHSLLHRAFRGEL